VVRELLENIRGHLRVARQRLQDSCVTVARHVAGDGFGETAAARDRNPDIGASIVRE
jgi:hypothetical protein